MKISLIIGKKEVRHMLRHYGRICLLVAFSYRIWFKICAVSREFWRNYGLRHLSYNLKQKCLNSFKNRNSIYFCIKMEEGYIECLGEARYSGINRGNRKFVNARLRLEFNNKLNAWVCKLWCGNEHNPRINYDLLNPRKMLELPSNFLSQMKAHCLLQIPFRNGTTVNFRQDTRTVNLENMAKLFHFLHTSPKRITYYSKQNSYIQNLLNSNSYDDVKNKSTNFTLNGRNSTRRLSYQSRTNSFRYSNDSWTNNHQYNNTPTKNGKCDYRHESPYSTINNVNNSFSNGKNNLGRAVLQETSNVTQHPPTLSGQPFHKENAEKREYSFRNNFNYHSSTYSHNHHRPHSQEPRFYSPTRSHSHPNHHRWQPDFSERLESNSYDSNSNNHTPRRNQWQQSFSYNSEPNWISKRANLYKTSPVSQKSNSNFENQNNGNQTDDYNSSVHTRTHSSRSSIDSRTSYLNSAMKKASNNMEIPSGDNSSKSDSHSTPYITHVTNFYGKNASGQSRNVSSDLNISSQERASVRVERSPVLATRKRSLSTPEISPKRPRSIALNTSENKENRSYSFLGLKNLGNTCYMNVVLQVLLAADCFFADVRLIIKHLSKTIGKESLLRYFHELYMYRRESFYGNQQQLRSSEEKKNAILESIKKAAGARNDNFIGNHMQDAQEFLNCILQALKDEINEANKVPETNIVSLKESDSDTYRNPICENFGFKIKETLVCKQCGNVVIKQQDYYELPINLPENRNKYSIQSMLDDYFKPDSRDYVCQRKGCNHSQSTASSELLQLPRILIIHLKRVVFNSHASKNNKPVKIPVYITVKECSQRDIEDPPSLSSDEYFSLTNGAFHSVQRRLFSLEIPSSDDSANSSEEDSVMLLKTSSSGPEQKTPSTNRNGIREGEEKENLIKRNSIPNDGGRCIPYDQQLSRNGLNVTEIGLRGGYPQQENISVEADQPLHGPLNDHDFIKNDAVFMSEEVVEEVFAEIPTTQEEEARHLQAAMAKSLEQNEDNDLIEAQKMSLLELEDQNGNAWDNELPEDNGEEGNELDANKDGSQPHSYRLVGIIAHNGNSSCGHYFAEVYRFQEKKWFTCNDDKITEITEQQVCEKCRSNGYLFFYLHKNIYDELNKENNLISSCG